MTIADPDNDDYDSGYDYDPSGRIPGHLRRFCWRCLLLWVCVAIVVTGIYAVLYHGGFLR